MPALPLRPCAEPGCGKVVLGRGRCPEHARARARAIWSRQDEQRGTTTERDYGQAWRGRRAAVLQREPLCRAHRTGRLDLGRGAWQAVEVRTEGASVVDHILARELGGSEDESNLQPLCVACNKTKTIADVKAVQARRVPCTS